MQLPPLVDYPLLGSEREAQVPSLEEVKRDSGPPVLKV